DAGGHAATAVQARVSYDFEGDGAWDRVETYRYYALNDVPGWEKHTEVERDGLMAASGAWGDFRNGNLRIELWSALGAWPISIATGAPDGAIGRSRLSVPFDFSVAPEGPADGTGEGPE